jgi:enoyl-CoA hydratase/carnithine racemase
MDLEYLQVSTDHGITHLRLNRPDRRNAVNRSVLTELETFFTGLGEETKVVVMSGEGAHFSAGLDLSEHQIRKPMEVYEISRYWHRVTDAIQFGWVPVISALHGGVIGGGLEIAASTHVRVADRSAFFQLPEGKLGIFVGGGGSVRVAKIIGPDRMTEMMLTGRTYDADEGYRLGLTHYLVDEGQALERAFELAQTIMTNAPLSNWASITAVANIGDMSTANGLYTESLATAITQSSHEAHDRMRAFFDSKKRKS